jgi:hypothetical protein
MMSTPVSINASQASWGAIYSVNTKRKGAFTSFNLLQLYEHPFNHLFLPMDAAYPLFLFALSLSLSRQSCFGNPSFFRTSQTFSFRIYFLNKSQT